jgi:hypothetical protein
MGKILKTKNLTTLAEGFIVTVGIGLICTISYFFIPSQGVPEASNGDAIAADSSTTIVNEPSVQASTPQVATPQVQASTPQVATPSVVKETKSVAKAKKEKATTTTKTVKETKKKGDSRENLDIQF